jgi:hypothetical protein
MLIYSHSPASNTVQVVAEAALEIVVGRAAEAAEAAVEIAMVDLLGGRGGGHLDLDLDLDQVPDLQATEETVATKAAWTIRIVILNQLLGYFLGRRTLVRMFITMDLDRQLPMVDLREADPQGLVVVATDQDGLLVQDHPDQVAMARDLETTVILEVITLRTAQEIKGNNTKEGKYNCKLARYMSEFPISLSFA